LGKILKNRTHLIAKIFKFFIMIICFLIFALIKLLLPQLPALARVTTIRGILPPLLPVREDKCHVPKLVARDANAALTMSPLP
jgi:hypothetical protein